MFCGLKANGRPFFKDKSNNKETPYYSINFEFDGDNFKKLEAVGLIIKLSNNENNGKEYFFSISKQACNADLFDFNNDKVYTKLINSFATLYDLRTLRSALIPLSSSNPILEYYYIFGFVSNKYNLDGSYWEGYKFVMQKNKFGSLNEFENVNIYTRQYADNDQNLDGLQTSCFQTVNRLINFFYSTNRDNNIFYNIIKIFN